jgi:hypothetical protein
MAGLDVTGTVWKWSQGELWKIYPETFLTTFGSHLINRARIGE